MGVAYGLVSGLIMVLFGRTACLIFLSAEETQILDAAELYLRTGGYIFWVLGILNVTRLTVQGLGYSGRAMFAGVMEMFARIGVVTLFVPAFGYNAIVFADPTAWVAADVYIVPTCMYVLRKVERELAGRSGAVVSFPEQEKLSVGKSA